MRSIVGILIILALVVLTGCTTKAETVAIRTGVINNYTEPGEICYEGWRCEGGERYYLTEECEKEDIFICRIDCSETEPGECVPTEEVEVKEFFREDSGGTVIEIERVRAEDRYTRISFKYGEARQVYFSEDDWYIVMLSGLRDERAFFSIDGQEMAPLRKGGITHHDGIFIRIVDLGISVEVDVGKTS